MKNSTEAIFEPFRARPREILMRLYLSRDNGVAAERFDTDDLRPAAEQLERIGYIYLDSVSGRWSLDQRVEELFESLIGVGAVTGLKWVDQLIKDVGRILAEIPRHKDRPETIQTLSKRLARRLSQGSVTLMQSLASIDRSATFEFRTEPDLALKVASLNNYLEDCALMQSSFREIEDLLLHNDFFEASVDNELRRQRSRFLGTISEGRQRINVILGTVSSYLSRVQRGHQRLRKLEQIHQLLVTGKLLERSNLEAVAATVKGPWLSCAQLRSPVPVSVLATQPELVRKVFESDVQHRRPEAVKLSATARRRETVVNPPIDFQRYLRLFLAQEQDLYTFLSQRPELLTERVRQHIFCRMLASPQCSRSLYNTGAFAVSGRWRHAVILPRPTSHASIHARATATNGQAV